MAELSNKLKIFLARELQRQFTSLDNSVGLFIGGTNFTGSGVFSIDEENKTRRQIQTCKLLDDNKVSLMIPRVNWKKDTIYQNYSLNEDNTARNFYVYTSERNVYVCVSNGGGKKSIEEPTGTGSSLVYLSNGYIWKFMYKIPDNLSPFIDEDYIPIEEVPLYTGKPFPYENEKQLQYSVQYDARSGVVENILVDSRGDEFPYVVKASANAFVRQGSTTNTILLDPRASTINDVYNDYTIRIISGTGAGQFRKIKDYDAVTKTATLYEDFETLPNQTSKYEILPTVTITGDGTDATAYAKLSSYASNNIESVVVVNKGLNYTTADATTEPSIATDPGLSVYVNPVAGLGREPIFDLIAKRVSILVRMEGREGGSAPLGNDYRQYGLWLSPLNNNGVVAGTEGYKQTKVDIETVAGGVTFTDQFAVPGQFVFGSESYTLGRVSNQTLPAFTVIGPTRGQLTLDGVNAKYKRGEVVYVFEANNPDGTPSGGFTFTSRTAKVTNTLLEDSIRFGIPNSFRCSHKLSVGRSAGVFDSGNPFAAIPYDSGVTGGSGSVGFVLDFTNISESGGSGDLFVTGVVSGSSADSRGFTGGETLTVSNGTENLELTIESASPPELNLFSGQLLYITSIEQVTRNTEQVDLFKINFDF